MANKKCVVIVSGGLDSVTLLHYIANKTKLEIHPISYMYGQKHKKEIEMAKWQIGELKKAKKNIKDLRVVNLKCLKDITVGATALTDSNIKVPKMMDIVDKNQPITYVPFRNTLFLSLALSYAESVGAETIYYGAQRQDDYGYWDCTTEFVKKLNDLASLNRLHKIIIKAPFVNLSKAEEIIIGRSLGINYTNTLTCYKGNNCGVCPTCTARAIEFSKVGIRDPINYQAFKNWDAMIKQNKQDLKISKINKKIVI